MAAENLMKLFTKDDARLFSYIVRMMEGVRLIQKTIYVPLQFVSHKFVVLPK